MTTPNTNPTPAATAAGPPIMPADGEGYPDDTELAGGPQDGDPAPSDGEPVIPPAAAPAVAAPAAPAAPQNQQIIVNGRVFNSAAELAHYTAEVERKVLAPAGQTTEKYLIDGKPAREVMFENPERYNEWILEQSTLRATEAQAAVTASQRNEQSWWNDFWTKNPDLKQFEYIVQSKFRDTLPELRKVSPGDAMSQLAKDSRNVVDTIKQSAGIKTTELASGGATALGPTGTVAPRGIKPEPKPVSFVDQVKNARKKRA